MSAARQRAEQTLQQGVQTRRDWNPSPVSAHYRVYRWWSKRTNRLPARENFCHYWRVVLIWAPLRFFAKPLLITLVGAVVLALVWLCVAFPKVTPFVLLGLLGIVATIAYMSYMCLITQQVLDDLNIVRSSDAIDWFDVESRRGKILLAIPALPLLLIVALPALAVDRIEKRTHAFTRFGRWLVSARPAVQGLGWLRPWLVAPAALIVLACVPSRIQPVMLVLGIIVAGFAALVGIIIFIGYLVDRARERAGRRERAYRRAETDRLFVLMFNVVHPGQIGNTDLFERWRDAHLKSVRERWSRDPYELDEWYHLLELSLAQRLKVRELLERRDRPAVRREPTRAARLFRRFGSNVGDYLSLIWSVVLTNKWKICPWVEISDLR